jgi:hypothetical protein
VAEGGEGRRDRHLHLLSIFGAKIKIKINRNIAVNAVIMAIVLSLFIAEGESSAFLR